jgi:predicted dehydrogenase
MTEVLCGLVAPSTSVSVHSAHNAEGMSAWAAARCLADRVQVSSEWPSALDPACSAIVVANAARDHERSVEQAVAAGVPVLVEKPMALTAAGAQRLAELARSRNGRLAAAHVFCFARYVDRFSTRVAEAGPVRFVGVQWTDPQAEDRHGEPKHYDPGLPILADLLPHIVSIVSPLTSSGPDRCDKITVLRGGAHVELDLTLGDLPCRVKLARNSDARRRVIEARVGSRQDAIRLDFSTEPGIISDGPSSTVGDPGWAEGPRPVARMLTAFLQWAAGGKPNPGLDVAIALRACRMIDETLAGYRAVLMPWLSARRASHPDMDDDLRYALRESLSNNPAAGV